MNEWVSCVKGLWWNAQFEQPEKEEQSAIAQQPKT